ncbi:MAG: hypothetical protein JRI75_01485 [Deltaproteobacteria bacterium]|nr:hypothetical protein [Deltaproteobacteria bacterium]
MDEIFIFEKTCNKFSVHPEMANFRNPPEADKSLRWAPNFNPQNTQCIPAVKILTRFDLAKVFSFLDGHKLSSGSEKPNFTGMIYLETRSVSNRMRNPERWHIQAL